MNTELVMDLLTRFIRESDHMQFSDDIPPVECLKPVIILQDDYNDDNPAKLVDTDLEHKVQKTFIFQVTTGFNCR